MKRWASGVVAAMVVAFGVVANPATASAQTVTHTFLAVQCVAVLGTTQLTQTQDITVGITAPDSVTPGQTFTITFPGGSSLLPNTSNGLNITSYSNLTQTFQIKGTTFNPGSITSTGDASVLPTAGGAAQTVTESFSLPAPDKLQFGQPGPFPAGTLTTPDVSVMATAPASGDVTLNAFQLTTQVRLNNAFNASVTCAVPTDTIITIPGGPANTPPTVNAGPDVSGNIGDTLALAGSVTDPDSTPTQQWTVDSPYCTFADPTAAATTISCTHAGVFAATLTANDGVNAPVSDVAQVTIVSPNVPPTVNAGPDVSGQALDDISLHGTVTDPDSTPITTWTVDSPNCTFSDATVPDTVINCDTPGTYAATLTADDGVNAPVSDTAQVVVSPIPPGLSVSAGPDATGNTSTAIAMKGKVTDPGKTPTTQWVVDSPNCTFADPTAPATTITCTSAGVFAATILAHDGVNPDTSSTALVTVVQPNVAPVVNAGPDVTGIKATPIALHGTVVDPDSTPTIQWTIDSPGCTFSNAAAADTTVTCASGGVFAATLTADDGVNAPVSDVALVTVYANVPPTVNAGPDVTGTVNSSIALHGTVTDPDNTPTVQWSTGSPTCTFANPAAADTTITCTAPGIIAATLTANDGVNAPVSDTALVTVIQPNTPPLVSAGPDVSGVVRHALLLNGTVTDPDSTPTVHWATGSPSCSFGNPNIAVTTITCTTTGIFAATLTADDGVNAPVHDTALVVFSPPLCTGPCVSVGDVTTYEGGTMAFPITLNVPVATAVTFTATIVPVTATNGYKLPAGSPYDFKSTPVHKITILAGKHEAFLTLSTVQDNIVEPDEAFNVVISQAVGATIGRSVGVGIIKDATGMPPGELLIGSSSIVEVDTCNGCTATAKVPVVLSQPAAAAGSVKYQTADAGATAGLDYTARKVTTLNFAAGSFQKLVTVVTIGDNLPEPTEGINFVFSSPTNLSLGNGTTGLVDILDND